MKRNRITYFWQVLVILILSAMVVSCGRSQIKSADSAMRVPPEEFSVHDRVVDDDFLPDLYSHLVFWASFKDKSDKIMRFGPYRISASLYAKSLEDLYQYCTQVQDKQKCAQYLRNHFVPLEVYGRNDWSEVFMTSYYSPLMDARKKPEGPYTYPIYRKPVDLVEIDLRSYFKNSTLTTFENPQLKPLLPDVLRGRLVSEGAQKNVVPYYTREEIANGALSSQKLEAYYVDPLEAFFLHIQGSGTLVLPGGEKIHVVYDGQNGHRYEAVGKFLKDKIPLEDINLHTIEAHLRKIPSAERDQILNKNPSYVFFKESEKPATTSFGIIAQARRTIATDPKYFPKGAMGLLIYNEPQFEGEKSRLPASDNASQRLVFDHDTGGAIKGPDRIDFYWGSGLEAKIAAGVIKDTAKLYYWFPRSALRK